MFKVFLCIAFVIIYSQQSNGQGGIQTITFNYDGPGHLVQPNYREINITIERVRNYFEINVYTDSKGSLDLVMIEARRRALEAARNREDSIKFLEKMPDEKIAKRTFEISKEEFENIVLSINEIKPSEISKDFGKKFIHGYSCEIQFGDGYNYITYHVHSPGVKGKKRGNPNFSKACRLILEAAGIKPRKAL